MPSRTVEVDFGRIERWITNFAARHGGATIEPITLGAGTRPDPPAPHRATDPSVRPDGDRSPGSGMSPGSDMLPSDVLRLRGADGEIADLSRWSATAIGPDDTGSRSPADPGADHTSTPEPAPDAARPRPGDATAPEALAAITAWLAPPTHLGLVLIRRGGYAVGRAEGSALASHKSGTRYVQSRTAAGGWSQQRFARRRGNQADALVGTVVDLAVWRLLPAPVGSAPRLPQAMVLGGDRALVRQVVADPALADLAALPTRMFADLPEPRFAVLEQALRRGRSIPVQITHAQ